MKENEAGNRKMRNNRTDTKYIKRRLLPALLILTLTLSSVGCTTLDRFTESMKSDAPDSNTIRIGVFEPLTGADAEGAKAELRGIRLAHELYPEAAGKKIELVYEDNKSEIAYVKTAAQQLIDKGIVAAIGSYGNTYSLAAGTVFAEAKVPIIGATCTNPLITAGNPYYFRVCIVDSFQGTMAAKYVFDDLDEKTAFIMKALGDDYGTALSEKFSEKMAAMTGDKDPVSLTVEYKRGTVDYSKQLTQIKAAGDEPVYLPCTAQEAAAIVRQARAEGMKNIFIGPGLWHNTSLITGAGAAAEGVVFTTFADVKATLSENTKTFRAAYAKKYKTDVPPASKVGLGFDAYLLAVSAIERQQELKDAAAAAATATENDKAGNDKAGTVKPAKTPTLRDVLQSTKEFMGATGSLSFGTNGDPIKPVVFMTVKNGKFLYKYTAIPEWGS